LAFFNFPNANAITLEEAIKQAFTHNAKWLAAVLEDQANQQATKTAMAAFYPSISADASMGDRSSNNISQARDQNTLSEKSHSKTSSLSLSAKQSLLNFSTFAQVKQAKENANASKYNLAKTKQDIILAVLEAYLGLWAAYENVKISRQNEKNLAQDLDVSRKRLEVGIGIRQDVAANEAAHAEAVYHRIDAESKLASAVAEFKKTVGVEPDGRLEPLELPTCLPDDFDKFMVETARRNPSLIASRYQTQASEADVDTQRGALMPTVGLSVEASNSLSDVDSRYHGVLTPNKDQLARNFSATVSLSVPILTCPSYGRIRQASLKAQSAKMNYLLMRQEVTKACHSYWAQFQTTKAQVKQAELAVKSAEIAVDGMRQCLTVGTKSTTDVLQQEQRLLQCRKSRVEATKNYIMTAFTLMSLAGRLGLETVAKGK
jgi:TolC family type I secretion outer membrane protein